MLASLHEKSDGYRTEREARLEQVLAELERRYGPWIVYRLRDARPALGEAAIPTGALSLDLAIGSPTIHLAGNAASGGIPRGRITEIVGPATSGKSSLAFHVLASAQQRNGFVAYIDSTHEAPFEQMQRCGVSLSDLFLAVPESLQEALEIATLLVESDGLDALVIGPLADLVHSSSARQLSERLARLNAVMHASPTAVLFLTEARSGFAFGGFSSSRALRHFASLRLQVDPIEPLLHPSGDVSGLRIRATVIKNKLAPPGRETLLELSRERGIRREADLLDLARSLSLVHEEPLGLCFRDRILGRGRERAIATLEAEPDLALELESAIRQAMP